MEGQGVALDRLHYSGLVLFAVGAARDGHAVARTEHRSARQRQRVVTEGGAARYARLQRAEGLTADVVKHLVRKDDDFGAHHSHLVSARTHVSAQDPIVQKINAVDQGERAVRGDQIGRHHPVRDLLPCGTRLQAGQTGRREVAPLPHRAIGRGGAAVQSGKLPDRLAPQGGDVQAGHRDHPLTPRFAKPAAQRSAGRFSRRYAVTKSFHTP